MRACEYVRPALQRVFVVVCLLVACTLSTSAAVPQLALQNFVSGLRLPIGFEIAPDGSGRIFIIEQRGFIRIIKNGVIGPQPFLNISSLVECCGERGLIGLAFHPQYQSNGRFFVDYTRRVSGQLQVVIAEYHVSATNPNKADPNGIELLSIDKPFDNHNGGQLAFGPDGYLYIGVGDGGSGGDPFGNGQNLEVLLGKILRIDINSGAPYAIPPDNPFVNDPTARGEIWAYGLRNPWKFSFDRQNGRLFAGDVGQNNWEEVDLITKGSNYGWNVMEGFHCYPPGTPDCDMTGLTLPLSEYSHLEGDAIIGGFVYHGISIPQLQGLYVFGDYISGKVYVLKQQGTTWKRGLSLESGIFISAFGQDASGELYVLDYNNGIVYRLVAA